MRRLLPLTLILAAVPAVPAHADSVVAADPTAANVTAYGATSAWSRRADDGTYRLVIRAGRVIADAPVPSSPVPFDPDLGPTSDNRRVIVYARGGDLYRFDVGASGEQRIANLSSRSATERAPSFFKDRIAFAREGGSKPGWYLYRPGRALKRLTRVVPTETDLADTRVTAKFGGIVRLSNYGGDEITRVAEARSGEALAAPTLSRFNVYWVRLARGRGSSVAERVGVNAHRGLQSLRATRRFDGRVTSMASTNEPALYTDARGVVAIEPHLRFAAAG